MDEPSQELEAAEGTAGTREAGDLASPTPADPVPVALAVACSVPFAAHAGFAFPANAGLALWVPFGQEQEVTYTVVYGLADDEPAPLF